MTYQQILSDLNNRIYHPVYFLMGEEPWFIDRITETIEKHVLNEEEKTFNQIVFYGKDTNIETVINAAKRYPMMANQQVVILKEAQYIKDITKLIYYLEQPLKSTILVINYKYNKLDKRTKFYKSLEKTSLLFKSDKLYENHIPGWIDDYLKTKGYTLEPGIGIVLTDFLGNDLSKIVNELEKLIIVIPPGQKKITASLVEKNIGISKDFNNFELHKALSRKDILKANRIAQYFCNNPKSNPLTVTLASLYFFFSKVLLVHYNRDKSSRNLAATLKVNPFFIKDYEQAARNYSSKKVSGIISSLREVDRKSKGAGNVSSSDCDLLRELIYIILH